MPRVWVDFNKTGGGRVESSTLATRHDLDEQGIELSEGLMLTLWQEDADDQGKPLDLEVDARIEFDSERNVWVAFYDMNDVRWVPPAEPRSA